MAKLYSLTSIILLAFCFNSIAQQSTIRKDKIVPVTKPIGAEMHIPVRDINPTVAAPASSSATPLFTVIGYTTYDLQTNKSATNSLYNNGNNIGGAWTFSSDPGGNYPDRGTAVNHSGTNGTTWQAQPGVRIEANRTGWGNIDMLGTGECFLAHKGNDSLQFYYRPTQGTGSWVGSGVPYSLVAPVWPRMKTGGANGQSVHVIACSQALPPLVNGMLSPMMYYRSLDGGVTWDQSDVFLPGVDSTHYYEMAADAYAIDVKGDIVAIVHAGLTNDFILWKSFDNGSTWLRTVIKNFPVAAYNQNTMNTDLNLDGAGDTVETTDGSVEVLIDNNGMVHCWVGRMFVLQDPGSSLGYLPTSDGLFYWNEQFPLANPVVLVSALTSGGLQNIGPNIPTYNTSLCSMPTAGIDNTSNIYLAYSAIVEGTINGAGLQSYRNVYCIKSPDNGQTWSAPVNLSDDNFSEAVYPVMARDADSFIHIKWMLDGEPGTALLESDPISTNDIVYDQEDTTGLFTSFAPLPPHQNIFSGTVFFDANQNGVKDPGENGMWQQAILLLPSNVVYYTSTNGEFNFFADSGTHTVQVLPGTNFQLTSAATYNVTAGVGQIFSNLDFGLTGISPASSLISWLTGSVARCNGNVNHWINYANDGNMALNGVIKFVKDPDMTFVQSNPPFNSSNGDTLFWNYSNLLPFEQRSVLLILNISPPALNPGDTVINCAEINFHVSSTSSNCLQQIVVCSFDPNDKMVTPAGVGASHYTLLSDTLQYTIRFQNTGTDTAFTVRIKDTLDPWFDLNSFKLLTASHPVQTRLNNDGSLEFLFANILLPDSNTNQAASNGFVKYAVKPKASTPPFTTVYNTAYIFFDFNDLIATNTTFNTLINTLGTNDNATGNNAVLVYPNPFKEYIQIKFSNTTGKELRLEITDLAGRVFHRVPAITTESVLISTKNISGGIYFYRLLDMSDKVIGSGKIVAQ